MTDFWEVVFTPSFMPRIMHVFVATLDRGCGLRAPASAPGTSSRSRSSPTWAGRPCRSRCRSSSSSRSPTPSSSAPSRPATWPRTSPPSWPPWRASGRPRTARRPTSSAGSTEAPGTTTGLAIPGLLSFLGGQDTIDRASTTSRCRRRVVNLTFQSYHLMVGLGMAIVPFALLAAGLWFWKRKLLESPLGAVDRGVHRVRVALRHHHGLVGGRVRSPALDRLRADADRGRRPRRSSRPRRSWSRSAASCSIYTLLLVLFLYLLERQDPAWPGTARGDRDPARSDELPDTLRGIFTARGRGEERMTDDPQRDLVHPLRRHRRRLPHPRRLRHGRGHPAPAPGPTDSERRTLLNSIGPVWDGNEVWLILGGGVLFAIFPFAYASLFSGFYIAFMLVLVVLILRAVHARVPLAAARARRWRTGWDLGSSAVLAGAGAAAGRGLRRHHRGRAARRDREDRRSTSSSCSRRSRCWSA